MSEGSAAGDARLPVTLLTGCLGSGKTTLLAALLQRPGMEQVAVVVNEFGEVPLDQVLIERADDHVVVLSGGCLCCAARGDVVSTLGDLLARRQRLPFSRIIIESSGLAHPGPILAPLLQDGALTPHLRLDGVIATADALQGERELQRQRVARQQLAMADRIVLTKSDIAAPRAVARLQQLIAEINPWAEIRLANHGAVSEEWLLSPHERGFAAAAHAALGETLAHHGHDHGIASFCVWLDQPVAWPRLAAALQALTDEYGERLLRIKGLLHLQGHAQPFALHGIHHFFHPPAALKAWPDGERRSRIVFITDRVSASAVLPFFGEFRRQAGARCVPEAIGEGL
jgi:G3E family GTPase